MAPKHTSTGPHAHYPAISAVAPEHTTGGPRRSEYSDDQRWFSLRLLGEPASGMGGSSR